MRKTVFNLPILALALCLTACSGAPTYNPTTFPYQIEQEKVDAANIRTVVIPHVNLGGVSRNYLEKEAPRIDAKVAAYLKENGYKVLPQRTFEQHWNTAVRAYGNPIDPTSGKVNRKTFSQIMFSVRDAMAASSKLDAFVFTDLLEMQTAFNGGLKHLARWDGVTRKPSLQGPGNAVSADFDWNLQAAVASIQITVYDMELQPLFTSRGGLDATDAIDTRSSAGRYVRRRNLLENDTHVMEGIMLALHPLVIYQDWPGNP
ncbi:MAG: hypothetical protein NXI15_16345 [Gammaproteobacteria bacterium]|jgi:hypothetical protein|nr:hypothetical protein [Gammaproteobacteria bacterium]